MVITDDFNRADGALGANWGASARTATQPVIVSSQAVGGTPTLATGALWIANTFGADQYAKARITALTIGYVGFLLRETDGTHGYRTQFDLTNKRVLIIAYVSNTLVAVDLPTLAIGDTVGFSVVGTLLSVYQNNVPMGNIVDAANAGPGSLGIEIGRDTSGIDDFEAGDAPKYLPRR